MAARPEGPFELAMTHLPVAGGRAVSHRPDQVIATARRLLSWRDAPVPCQSCSHHQARWIRQDMALCPSCRDNRAWSEGGLEALERRLRRHETFRAEPVAGDGLTGHAIVFDQWSEDLGGFRERIRPDAINRTIEENIDLRALWNHNTDLALGRMSAGTMTRRKDRTGLLVHVVPPSWAVSHLESVGREDVTSQSFGFRTVDDEWNFDGPIPLRDVLDMRVSETSFVVFPAYPQTTARLVKGLELKRDHPREYYESRLKIAR